MKDIDIVKIVIFRNSLITKIRKLSNELSELGLDYPHRDIIKTEIAQTGIILDEFDRIFLQEESNNIKGEQ